MARKGWDALSDAYRDRLVRKGVTKVGYESGVPLEGARGHISPATEKWQRDTAKFARDYTRYRQTNTRSNVPFPTEKQVRDYVRGLGRSQGRLYMSNVRAMVADYESGNLGGAQQRWVARPSTAPNYMYYYHGIFGY